MFGVSIDNEPDAPVGTPDYRRTLAIHWAWTTEYTPEEIGKALGVTGRTVEKYLKEGPGEAVQEQLANVESEVRLIAVRELKQQLRAAGHESRTAEAPVKIYQDDDGDLIVEDDVDDDGTVVDRFPVPVDLEMGADQTTRYYRREEVRTILDLLTDIVGAKAAEQHEVTGEGGGPLEVVINDSIVTPDDES